MDEVRWISTGEVMSLLDPDDLRDAIVAALRALAAGEASVPPRVGARTPAGIVAAMPGFVPGSPACVKLVSVFPGNADRSVPSHQALIAVFDAESGTPLAVMDGTAITAIRTAATSAVAATVLAPRAPRVLAILGAGVQGRSHLEAFAPLHPFDEIRIASRRTASAEALAGSHVSARAVGSFEAAVRGADVVCCCTDAHDPFLDHGWLGDDALVCSVGSGAEVAPATVTAARVVVEWRGAVTNPPPAGAAELQGIDPDSVTELGAVLAGTSPGRRPDDGVILYKSTGHAVEDVAAAELVYRRAVELGVGRLLKR